MPFTVTSSPALEPVTLAELKDYLRISDASQDQMLGTMISAARRHVEQMTRRPMIEQSIKATFEEWPVGSIIVLPVGNVLTIESLKYRDESNVLQTVSTSDYVIVTADQPGRIYLRDSFTFPALFDRSDAIEAAITAGYGSTSSSVPEPLRIALMALAGYWFEQRLPVNVGNIVNQMPMHVQALINLHRVIVSE